MKLWAERNRFLSTFFQDNAFKALRELSTGPFVEEMEWNDQLSVLGKITISRKNLKLFYFKITRTRPWKDTLCPLSTGATLVVGSGVTEDIEASELWAEKKNGF